MSARDREHRSHELMQLPGELFESMHPAIEFGRDDLLRERAPLASRIVDLLARASRRGRDESQATETEEVNL